MTIDWQMEADRANRLYAAAHIEQLEERMRGANALIVLWETRATRAEARVEKLEAALRRADQFITNGIELGYIKMPDADVPDSAHQTPGIIRAALAPEQDK